MVNIGRFYAKWDYKLSDSKSFESRFNVLQCIKPVPSIQNVATKAVQAMRLKYPSSKTTAIHPRLEADWVKHCGRHKLLTECWIDELEWSHRLKESFNMTPESPILLIDGQKFKSSPFEQNNLTVFTKLDLLQPHDLSDFQYTSSLAAIDFFLALEVDNFYGFMWSSMDLMIYESRLYNCLPSESIHIRYGPDWLHHASSWSNSFFFYRLEDAICHYKKRNSACDNIAPKTKISENCENYLENEQE